MNNTARLSLRISVLKLFDYILKIISHLRKIAIALRRNVSTISREIAHCQALGFKCYIADYRSKIETVINRKAYKLKGKLLKTVKYLLKKKFSPKQISAYLFSRKDIKISHTAIKTYFIIKPKTEDL